MVGEKLEYELHFNWKFVWVKAGTATMETKATTYNSQPALRSLLELKGTKRADFYFTLRDTLEAVMSEDLIPFYFRKGAEEGKRYTLDQINFSYADGKTYVKQSRHRSDRDPKYNESEESRCVYDMLSLLAIARSFDFSSMSVGDKIAYPMATGTKIQEQTLIYRKKENFKAADSTVYRCLVLSLVEHEGDKKKEKEVITFYVTDDDNHLPIRLDMYLNFGSARANLTDISGNRYPLTSIVEKKK